MFFIAAFVGLGSTAIKEPRKSGFKNLKVLPQDISEQKLDSIMHSYNIALNVDCKFCHAAPKANNLFPFNKADSIDFASDAEPMKESARDMIRMNVYINKTYFYFDKNEKPEYLHTITCITCHKGEPYPIH